MTVTDTSTWRACRHCGTPIRPSALSSCWIDQRDYDTCDITGDSHEPATVCRVVDQILSWVDNDGELNVSAGDLILDQGEMCAVEGIDIETLHDGSLWLHVGLRDPRRVDTGLPVSVHEFAGSGLVAVRRYLIEETS